MNLLIISDLHIDNGDNFGTFGWRPNKFIKFLDKLIAENGIDQVILNGDIFDLYKYTFKEVYAKNLELISYFNRRGFIYIRGNHDLFNPFAKDSHTIVNSKGQSIYIEHGHNADFLNGTRIGRAIGQAGFSILKKIVRYKWVEKIYFKIVEWDDQINRIPKKYNTFKYLNYALNLLRSYDVVVLGHTHKLESHKTYYLNTKKIYLNTGTCSLGRLQAILLDTESLKYDTLKFSKSTKPNWDLVKLKDLERKTSKSKSPELSRKDQLSIAK
jgi:predicted phosphodiesterase